MGYSIISQITSPTSDAINFTGLSLSGWYDIQIRIDGVTLGTDGAALQAQFYIGGSLISSGYRYQIDTYPNGTTNVNEASTSAASILLTRASANGIGNATDETYSGVFALFNSVEALHKLMTGMSVYTNSTGGMMNSRFTGHLANTGTLDGIKFTPSSGTLTAGKATIFGIQ